MNKRRIWLVVVPILLFSMLAICIMAGVTVGFEGWAYNEAIEKMSPALTSAVKVITHIGDSVFIITFCILLFIFTKTKKTIAIPVSITVIISSILNIILKKVFSRERPNILRLINETSYSFPSGHAMINASLYMMLILLIFKFIKNKPLKISLSAICLVLIIAIGYSRIYLGVHYAGDILGGWLIGYAISVSVYFIWNERFLKMNKNTKESPNSNT
jgi:undecaprenyl-diphosphatase